MFATKESQSQTNLHRNKPTLARKCTNNCPLEKEKPLVQRRANLSTPAANEAPPIVHEVLRSSGRPLDRSTRAFMEPRFNQDFSHVRVHTDGKAAESARAVNALAYTVGHDIVMRQEEYALATGAGKWLLAHELTHVVQQGGNQRLQKLQIGAVGDVYEREADWVAEQVTDTSQPIEKRGQQSFTYAVTPSSSGSSSVPSSEITLETGNSGASPINNLVHQQICVDKYGTNSRKRCFSFGAIGAQWPQFSSTWLGWNSYVVGAILKGQVYEASPVSGATVTSRHTPTAIQGTRWLRYMTGTRLGLQDAYSVARHNCRAFSQWEFRDAPTHW